MDATPPGLQVEKVAWRHALRRSCLVVPEVDPDMGLVWALVRREPNIPVNPGDGSTERAGVPDDVGTDLLQAVPGVADETHGRFEYDRLKLSLVRIKPFLAVVLRQTSEESEELRREIFSTFPHATLLLNALPILDHGSAVEHWREGTGVEDDPDRPDLVSSDAVPFADERRPGRGVRHHIVQDAHVVSVDEGLLRFHAFDDMVQFSERIEIGLWSMERVERSDEGEVVMEILPRFRHVAVSECSLVRRHDLLWIRHSSRSSGNAGASCHAAKIGPPGMRNQKKLPIPGMSTRGRTIAPPARSILREAASRSSTRT